MQDLNIQSIRVSDLLERVKNLEDKVFKKSKKEQTTRAQQMLLFKHLGLLEIIEKLEVPKKSKAKLLSVLLNGNADNIEDDLTKIHHQDSEIRTKRNYEFIKKTFEEVGLKSLSDEADKILDNLHRKG